MKDHGHEEQKLPGFQDFSSKQMFWISFTQIYCSKWTDDGIFKLIASVQNFVIDYIYIYHTLIITCSFTLYIIVFSFKYFT